LNRQRRADLWLVLVTAFWGSSYYLTDRCLTELPPMGLNALRFLTAFLVLGIIFFKNIAAMNRMTLKYSILVGLALAGTYIFYGYGISRTSLSNAGFICALAVVLTPIFEFFVKRKLPNRRMALALVLATLGLALLTLNESFRPRSGDILCFFVSVCYTLDLLLTEKADSHPEVDPLGVGICELAVVGLVTLLMSFLIEEPCLPKSPAIWAAALFLGVFCTGIAFVVQTVQQQYTTASHVGLIFTLEPVFSAFVAYFFAGEVLSGRGYFGALLMLASILLMEVEPWGKEIAQEKK